MILLLQGNPIVLSQGTRNNVIEYKTGKNHRKRGQGPAPFKNHKQIYSIDYNTRWGCENL